MFIKPEQIEELRLIAAETTDADQLQLVKDNLQDYEQLMKDFKLTNKRDKRRLTAAGKIPGSPVKFGEGAFPFKLKVG